MLTEYWIPAFAGMTAEVNNARVSQRTRQEDTPALKW